EMAIRDRLGRLQPLPLIASAPRHRQLAYALRRGGGTVNILWRVGAVLQIPPGQGDRGVGPCRPASDHFSSPASALPNGSVNPCLRCGGPRLDAGAACVRAGEDVFSSL